MIVYNKDIFNKVGILYLMNDWIWDEFLVIVKQVFLGEGVNWVYGIVFYWIL